MFMSEGELPPGRFVSKTPGKQEKHMVYLITTTAQFSIMIFQYFSLNVKKNNTRILKQEINFPAALLISFVRRAL